MDVLEGNGREGEEGAPALLGDQFHASIRRSPVPLPTRRGPGSPVRTVTASSQEQPGAPARDVTAEPRAGRALGLSRGRAPGAGGPCPAPTSPRSSDRSPDAFSPRVSLPSRQGPVLPEARGQRPGPTSGHVGPRLRTQPQAGEQARPSGPVRAREPRPGDHPSQRNGSRDVLSAGPAPYFTGWLVRLWKKGLSSHPHDQE